MFKTASVKCFLLVGFRFAHVNILAKKRESPYLQLYLTGKVERGERGGIRFYLPLPGQSVRSLRTDGRTVTS